MSWILAGSVLLTVTARLYLIFATRATEEDFYITLRYASNLAHGVGFVYNTGEHVLGTTTPLYTLLLALAIRLHLDPTLTGKLVSTAADAGSCLFAWRLGCALKRPLAGLCAGLCLAVAPLNLTESVKGMESGLVACACVGAWAFWAEGRSAAAWVCAALLALLRIDGAILAVILLAACLQRDGRLPWRGLLLYILLTLPWLLYATVAFGSPIPASLRAKLVVYGWHNSAYFPNLVPFLRIMTHNPLSLLLFVGASAAVTQTIWSWRARRKVRSEPGAETGEAVTIEGAPPTGENDRGRRELGSIVTDGAPPIGENDSAPSRLPPIEPMLAWLAVYYGGMAFSKVFLFGWYFLPPTPVYYLVAFVGWERLSAGVRGNLPSWKPRLTLPALAGMYLSVGVLLAVVTVPRVARTLRESQRVEDELRIPIGLWLKAHALPADTVMLEPIGYIGYYSDLRVLDTVGLVSPETLPFYSQAEESPYHALWTRFQPEWILLRSGEWEALLRHERKLPADQRLGARYREAQTWQSPGSPPDSAPVFRLFQRTSPPNPPPALRVPAETERGALPHFRPSCEAGPYPRHLS